MDIKDSIIFINNNVNTCIIILHKSYYSLSINIKHSSNSLHNQLYHYNIIFTSLIFYFLAIIKTSSLGFGKIPYLYNLFCISFL